MSKLFSSKNNPELKMVECSVCLEAVSFPKTIQLSCNHRFCIECLTREWEYNIMNGHISPQILKCPQEDCFVPITYFELKNHLKKEVFVKYDNFMIAQYKESDTSKEMTVQCPKANCNQAKYMVYRGASYFICKICKIQYCCDCNGEYPGHNGLTCQEFKEKDLTNEEKELRKTIRDRGWMQCPECKIIIEKIEFCNFIRCRSPICQKQTCFCYLCGEKLEEKNHYDHYKDKNPYGNACLGEIKKGEKQVKKKKEGNFTNCPQCDARNAELLENFNNKFCQCKICQNKIYCLQCKKEISEKKIMDHFESKDCDKTCRIF